MVLGKRTRQGQLKLGQLAAPRAQGQGREPLGLAFAFILCQPSARRPEPPDRTQIVQF
jgi:hypothetical protein